MIVPPSRKYGDIVGGVLKAVTMAKGTNTG